MRVCPSCGGRRVRLGSTLKRHLVRSILGTHRRFCLDCSMRWRDDHAEHASNFVRFPAAALVASLPLLIWAALRAQRDVEAGRPWTVAARGVPGAHGAVAAASGATAGANGYLEPQPGDGGSPSARPGGTASPPAPGGGAPGSDYAPSDAPGPSVSEVQAPSRPQHQSAVSLLLGNLTSLMKRPRMGPRPSDAQVDQILKTDKKTLWNTYGHFFTSKEQAKSMYEQVKRDRLQGKSVSNMPPNMPAGP